MQTKALQKQTIFIGGMLIVLMLMSGCAKDDTPAAITMTPDLRLTPYISATVDRVPVATTPTPASQLYPTPSPVPTATPFIYTVIAEDTLLGIALRYGITLEDLLGANPALDPQFLTIGAEVIIPLGGEQPSVVALPTPVPVKMQGPPTCYPAADGRTWCFLLVENDHPQPLENLAAKIAFYAEDGTLLASETALPPLNVLFSGKRMPLIAVHATHANAIASTQASMSSGIFVLQNDTRYLPLAVDVQAVAISDDGLTAAVTGNITNLDEGDDAQSAGLVWIVLVAYDKDGHVVGVRRWEKTPDLLPGAGLAFSLEVYSMGPKIVEVDVLAEGRP